MLVNTTNALLLTWGAYWGFAAARPLSYANRSSRGLNALSSKQTL
jgi:hypothetical protein